MLFISSYPSVTEEREEAARATESVTACEQRVESRTEDHKGVGSATGGGFSMSRTDGSENARTT